MSLRPRDGFTRDAYVAAVPKLYDELYFKFRPCTHEERLDWFDFNNTPGKTAKDRARRAGELLAGKDREPGKLVSWSRKQPINVQSLFNPAVIDPNLLARVLAIVLGTEVWDDPPEKDLDSDVEAAKEAAERDGVPFGEAMEERETKN